MGRSPSNDESGLKKGPWTPEEDEKLIKYIQKHGHSSWRALPKLAGLNRCGKSCRLRWTNYLRPDIKRGKFSQEEEQTILNLHAILGNKWSAIATHLPGRTDNEIKNFWNTHLKKKLIHMGFDPMTHRPRTDIFNSLPHLIALANLIQLNHPPPPHHRHHWDDQQAAAAAAAAARLQNEAAQMARLNHLLQNLVEQQPSPPPLLFPTNNNIADVASFNLLMDSVKSDASILGQLEAAPLSGDYFQEFSHLPELLQAAAPVGGRVDDDRSGLCKVGDCSSPWMGQSVSPAAVAEGGCASASSYGGSEQMWSELLDDPIFHEINA